MRYIKWLSPGILLLVLFLNSCSLDSMRPPTMLISNFDFSDGIEGWQASYANYAPSEQDSFKFSFDYGHFHMPNDTTTIRAMVQTADNRNGKLFMYVKRRISGLTPYKKYNITFNVHFYSQLRESYNIDSIGSTEGSFLKIGTFKHEPVNDTIPDVSNAGNFIIVPQFDPGQNDKDGADMIYLGKISYTNLKQAPDLLGAISRGKELEETADAEGKVWVAIGVSTNIMVYQSLYFSGIALQFEEK
jgi:hypothetical protein